MVVPWARHAANLGPDNRWNQLKREADHFMVLKAARRLLVCPAPPDRARALGGAGRGRPRKHAPIVITLYTSAHADTSKADP